MKIFSGKAEQRRNNRSKQSRLDWLIYLPGAIILGYGLWLSLTTPPAG
jgi:hypothetical protein